ncbi:hypothetical protein RF11_15883 [Thelohanellus kitauei]|uniref:Uncharacterized protein n=1 Tax=Thelohanellus kitauei TaxID=669202 RepID=A0A0C2N8R4_THEKT|nr:hypothetical protein RF11_15883 [Thelohanellus kitauei]
MEPSKLQRRLDMHPNFLNKDKNYFKYKANGVWKIELDNRKINETLQIADEIQLPTAKYIVRVMIGEEYPLLRILLPFPPTYLCKTGFSGLLFIKSKYRKVIERVSDLLEELKLLFNQKEKPQYEELDNEECDCTENK